MVLRAAGPSNRDLDTIQSHMANGSNASALLLAQAVASFSRSELSWELATIAAAVAILSIALAAIALFLFSPRDPRPDADLLWPVGHSLRCQVVGYPPL